MPLFLTQRLLSFVMLWQPIGLAIYYFFRSLPGGLNGILDRTFAAWWLRNAHTFTAWEEESPVPELVGMASGVVLEVGAGIGSQLPRFNRKSVSRIYGIEPNEQLFDALRDEAAKFNGQDEIYIPLNCAIEDDGVLLGNGVRDGSVDSILCMQVLCSVPDLDATSQYLYKLLKPGGQLIIWEHVANDDMITWLTQKLWNIFWTPFIGGCSLAKNIYPSLVKAGDWEKLEIKHRQEPGMLLPRLYGRLVKPKV